MTFHFKKRALIFLCAGASVISGCTVNNVDQDDKLARHFEAHSATGCFGLFDNARGRFTIYNLERFKAPYSPASTFKIVNALIALQTGVVTTDSTVIPWDGVSRERPEWNQDLSLYRAFRVSALPHFQELSRRIGRERMQYWLDSLHYGNRNIGPEPDRFWINGQLTITADEQLGLVKQLYFSQLPFRKTVQESVKKMMIQENNSVYQLAYKTGTGTSSTGKPLGWMVGWIEENRHVYPFVLNMEMDSLPPNGMAAVREKLLRDILTDLNFFKGRM